MACGTVANRRMIMARPWTRRSGDRVRILGTVEGLALLLMVVALCAGCGQRSSTSSTYGIGETASVGGWHVTLLGFYALPPDPSYLPEAGSQYCAVVLELENSTEWTRYVMQERQMLLVGEENATIAPHARAGVVAARTMQWFPADGEVRPGELITGAASYRIAAGSAGYTWRFRAGLLPWSEQAVFNLGMPR